MFKSHALIQFSQKDVEVFRVALLPIFEILIMVLLSKARNSFLREIPDVTV